MTIGWQVFGSWDKLVQKSISGPSKLSRVSWLTATLHVMIAILIFTLCVAKSLHCIKRMCKATGVYARFQPRTADFQKDVGDDVRVTLEAALERHSTLTEGNWISVPFAGSSFELLVQKLRPGKAVSVIGMSIRCCHIWHLYCSCNQSSPANSCFVSCLTLSIFLGTSSAANALKVL